MLVWLAILAWAPAALADDDADDETGEEDPGWWDEDAEFTEQVQSERDREAAEGFGLSSNPAFGPHDCVLAGRSDQVVPELTTPDGVDPNTWAGFDARALRCSATWVHVDAVPMTTTPGYMLNGVYMPGYTNPGMPAYDYARLEVTDGLGRQTPIAAFAPMVGDDKKLRVAENKKRRRKIIWGTGTAVGAAAIIAGFASDPFDQPGAFLGGTLGGGLLLGISIPGLVISPKVAEASYAKSYAPDELSGRIAQLNRQLAAEVGVPEAAAQEAGALSSDCEIAAHLTESVAPRFKAKKGDDDADDGLGDPD